MKLTMTIAWLCGLVVLLAQPIKATASLHVVKRSDDPNPLDAVVSRLAQDMATLQAEVQILKNAAAKEAAFQTGLSSQQNVTANAPILFSQLYSLGGGYDPHTGIYTVPFSGVYNFQFQMFPYVTATSVITDLVRDGTIVLRTRCDEGAFTTSCFSAQTMHVRAGDKLWVQSTHSHPGYNAVHSFFSGFLVRADP